MSEQQPTQAPLSEQPEPSISPRRRLQMLLAIPDSQKTEAQWEEINELEISLAPGNRADGPELPSQRSNPGGGGNPRAGGHPRTGGNPRAGGHQRPGGGSGSGGGGSGGSGGGNPAGGVKSKKQFRKPRKKPATPDAT